LFTVFSGKYLKPTFLIQQNEVIFLSIKIYLFIRLKYTSCDCSDLKKLRETVRSEEERGIKFKADITSIQTKSKHFNLFTKGEGHKVIRYI